MTRMQMDSKLILALSIWCSNSSQLESVKHNLTAWSNGYNSKPQISYELIALEQTHRRRQVPTRAVEASHLANMCVMLTLFGSTYLTPLECYQYEYFISYLWSSYIPKLYFCHLHLFGFVFETWKLQICAVQEKLNIDRHTSKRGRRSLIRMLEFSFLRTHAISNTCRCGTHELESVVICFPSTAKVIFNRLCGDVFVFVILKINVG